LLSSLHFLPIFNTQKARKSLRRDLKAISNDLLFTLTSSFVSSLPGANANISVERPLITFHQRKAHGTCSRPRHKRSRPLGKAANWAFPTLLNRNVEPDLATMICLKPVRLQHLFPRHLPGYGAQEQPVIYSFIIPFFDEFLVTWQCLRIYFTVQNVHIYAGHFVFGEQKNLLRNRTIYSRDLLEGRPLNKQDFSCLTSFRDPVARVISCYYSRFVQEGPGGVGRLVPMHE
jgi:hypothetical protein